MSRADFRYKRIPRASERGFIRKSSLWDGGDHLLLIRGTRFAEEYRRFYYRDIQAITVRRAARLRHGGLWALNLLALIVMLIYTAVVSVRLPHFAMVAGNIALVLGIVAALRLFLMFRYGAKCYVQTAVTREELPSLNRTWVVDRILPRLEQKIVAVQGTLDLIPSPSELPAKADSPQEAGTSKGNSKRAVNAAIATFVFIFLNAVNKIPALSRPTAGQRWQPWAGAALMILAVASSVYAIVVSERASRLRKLLTFALVFLGLNLIQARLLPSMYALVIRGTGFIAALRLWEYWMSIDVGIGILLAIGGLAYVLLNWDELRGGAPSQP